MDRDTREPQETSEAAGGDASDERSAVPSSTDASRGRVEHHIPIPAACSCGRQHTVEIAGEPPELSAQERQSVLASAQLLKHLGIPPDRLLHAEAMAELIAGVLRQEENATTPTLLQKMVPDPLDPKSPDALDAPSVRLHLAAVRALRKHLGHSDRCQETLEALPDDLDECADAIRLKLPRGKPVRTAPELFGDWRDHLTYVNLQRRFAERTGTNAPEIDPSLEAPAFLALLKQFSAATGEVLPAGMLPLEGEDLEPALSRQVQAFEKERAEIATPAKPFVGLALQGLDPREIGEGDSAAIAEQSRRAQRASSLRPAQRAALALYELKHGRVVTDDDLSQAEEFVLRFQRSLRSAKSHSE